LGIVPAGNASEILSFLSSHGKKIVHPNPRSPMNRSQWKVKILGSVGRLEGRVQECVKLFGGKRMEEVVGQGHSDPERRD
jgi:hypothetical protein